MSELPDFMHRVLADAKAADEEDAVTVQLTPAFLQNLSIAYKEMGELYLECHTGAGRSFVAGRSYGLCSASVRELCIIDADGHHAKIPLNFATQFFHLKAGKSQLALIEELAADVLADRLVQLRKLCEEFGKTEQFEVGDAVKWKPGMCNCVRPLDNETAIVIELIDPPIRGSRDTGSPEAATRNDFAIAVLDDGGELLHYLMDSRRFMKAGS